MRVLKFIVNGQIIKQDPNCDFSGLIPGTEGYLRAEFSFSPEWNGFTKVVSFRSRLGKEYPPQVLGDGRSCVIPREALAREIFKLQVIGKKNNLQLTTNRIAITQNGGYK